MIEGAAMTLVEYALVFLINYMRSKNKVRG